MESPAAPGRFHLGSLIGNRTRKRGTTGGERSTGLERGGHEAEGGGRGAGNALRRAQNVWPTPGGGIWRPVPNEVHTLLRRRPKRLANSKEPA